MDLITAFLTNWRRTLVLMILGGIGGFLLSLILPGKYSASVFLSTTIDYNKTGSLTELEEDRMLGVPEDIINSDPVLTKACEGFDACTPESFRENMRISRTLERWRLSVVDPDPAAAAKKALAWQTAAANAITDAYTHAIRADQLTGRLENLSEAVSDSTGAQPGKDTAAEFSALLEEINLLSAQISEEERLSHGLSSAIRLGSINTEEIELSSSLPSAAFGAAVGALAGLLAACGLAILSRPGKKETA